MRVLAVHSDVIVVVSGIWQTTCTAVRAGEEAFVIQRHPDGSVDFTVLAVSRPAACNRGME